MSNKKERLLKRYVQLQKRSKKRAVSCEVFLGIKDAIKSESMIEMTTLINKHSGMIIPEEDILWIIEEARKAFPDDIEHISQADALVAAKDKFFNEAGEEVETTIIKIKRSSDSPAPPQLEPGELAYSFKSNSLFIGDPDKTPIKLLEKEESDQKELIETQGDVPPEEPR